MFSFFKIFGCASGKNIQQENNYNYTIDYKSILEDAIRDGNCDIVNIALFENPKLINHQYSFGKTPLLMAARFGQNAIVELLLRLNADFTIKDENGLNPIMAAALFDHVDTVRLLLEQPEGLDQKILFEPAFVDVVSKNSSLETLKLFLQYCTYTPDDSSELTDEIKAYLNPRRGWTPLHFSVEGNNFMGVLYILRQYVMGNLDIKDVIVGDKIKVSLQKLITRKYGEGECSTSILELSKESKDINIKTMIEKISDRSFLTNQTIDMALFERILKHPDHKKVLQDYHRRMDLLGGRGPGKLTHARLDLPIEIWREIYSYTIPKLPMKVLDLLEYLIKAKEQDWESLAPQVQCAMTMYQSSANVVGSCDNPMEIETL